jgi:hypothetical protein
VNVVNRKIILAILALTLLIMFAAAPVFAAPPTRGTFSQGIVQVGVTSGKSFVTDDINHERGGTSASYIYGSPWGNSLPGTGGTGTTFQLNMVTFTGGSTGKTYDIFTGGVTVGTINNKFTGIGPYTYNGPSFTFDLAGISGEVTNGATYFGITFTGFGAKHGVSGDLKGLETMETYTGVLILAGPLTGVVLVDNTVAYKLPG